jgi:hypothetical protein
MLDLLNVIVAFLLISNNNSNNNNHDDEDQQVRLPTTAPVSVPSSSRPITQPIQRTSNITTMQ